MPYAAPRAKIIKLRLRLSYLVDYVFVLRETDVRHRRRLYEMFANSPLLAFDAFGSALDRATRDGGCLVIDNAVHSKKPEDFLFHYRAETGAALRDA